MKMLLRIIGISICLLSLILLASCDNKSHIKSNSFALKKSDLIGKWISKNSLSKVRIDKMIFMEDGAQLVLRLKDGSYCRAHMTSWNIDGKELVFGTGKVVCDEHQNDYNNVDSILKSHKLTFKARKYSITLHPGTKKEQLYVRPFKDIPREKSPLIGGIWKGPAPNNLSSSGEENLILKFFDDYYLMNGVRKKVKKTIVEKDRVLLSDENDFLEIYRLVDGNTIIFKDPIWSVRTTLKREQNN